MKKQAIFDVRLDEEEQEISDALDRGAFKSVDNLDEEMRRAKTIARNTLKKDARINVRISSMDLMRLKQKAAYKGLPYQTFIASILHEYAAGHFTEAA